MTFGAPLRDGLSSQAIEPVSRLDPDGLQSLAQDCEQASGASRKLDKAIWLGVVASSASVQSIEIGRKVYGNKEANFRIDRMMDGSRFTASFDEAVSLLPGPDWEYSLQWEHGSLYWRADDGLIARVEVGDPMLHMEAEAATPALAMCAAALRAIAAEARRAETVQQGSVHEGAAIAQKGLSND